MAGGLSQAGVRGEPAPQAAGYRSEPEMTREHLETQHHLACDFSLIHFYCFFTKVSACDGDWIKKQSPVFQQDGQGSQVGALLGA